MRGGTDMIIIVNCGESSDILGSHFGYCQSVILTDK